MIRKLFKKYKEYRIQERELKKRGCFVVCPQCDYTIDKEKADTMKYNDIYVVHCDRCKNLSYWNYDVAPVPLLCDSTGKPLVGETVC